MKYKIGQRLFSKNYCYDEDDDSDYEVVCISIFGDGTWKYGVKYDRAEYDCMIDFYTENEIEEEFATEKRDHEEPRKTWFIDTYGSVRNREAMTLVAGWDDKPIFEFETREETEKAREKLKAWQRLEDKGFRFVCWGGLDITIHTTGLGRYIENGNLPNDILKDLDLLFGGEE